MTGRSGILSNSQAGNDIREGQSVFLRYGLHDNGSVWGHGAYLGPDFSADYLHQVAMATRELNPGKSTEQINKIAKTNRYDSATGRLVLDNAQTSVFAEAPDYWKEYLSDPSNNGGSRCHEVRNAEIRIDLRVCRCR